MKRILSLLLALCALLTYAFPAQAEEANTAEYQGGIVERGRWRAPSTRALLDELTIAYLDTDAQYLISGCPVTFTIHAAGGDGNYSYAFCVYYREGNTGLLTGLHRSERSANPSFTYTPTHTSGQYMLLVAVYDEAGAYIKWQSQIFEVFPSDALNDAGTVPGRVRQLAAQCISQAGRSDYSRALWLHDWLIYNADYDESYTYYYADGVLLHGTGVCQSYALAYDLLLHEIGIESLFLTGTANGGNHAWNLVKLDGSWYHIDCTWDDPIGGGHEGHSYFALTDSEMALDHSWSRDKGIMPECKPGELTRLRQSLMICVTDEADFHRQLTQLVTEGVAYAPILLTGEVTFDVPESLGSWFGQSIPGLNGYHLSCLSSREYEIYLNPGNSYPGTAVVQRAVLLAHTLNIPMGERDVLDVLCLPARATEGMTWTSDNEAAVTVTNGVVRAVGRGSATVRLSFANGYDECRVFVLTSDTLSLPEGLQTLEAEAFADCLDAQTVRLPESLRAIGSRAFAECEGLLFVFFATADAEIASDAFEGCDNLTIHAPAGGSVAAFAKAHDIRFMISE